MKLIEFPLKNLGQPFKFTKLEEEEKIALLISESNEHRDKNPKQIQHFLSRSLFQIVQRTRCERIWSGFFLLLLGLIIHQRISWLTPTTLIPPPPLLPCPALLSWQFCNGHTWASHITRWKNLDWHRIAWHSPGGRDQRWIKWCHPLSSDKKLLIS